MLSDVQGGLFGCEGWNPEQYRLVMKKILSAAHYAVPLYDVECSIGTAALEALVKENLVTYRPFSGEGQVFLYGDAHIPEAVA